MLIAGASYRIPLYRLGDSIDFFGAYSNVNSGVVQNLFNVSGRGTIVAARYNRALPRWGDSDHKLTLGLDWRAYDSLVFPVGSGLKIVPDIIVHPLSLTWSALRRWREGETAVSAGISRNLPGGYDGGQETFDRVRQGAEADYSTFRFSANHLQTLPADLQARLRLTGQYTRDLLIPGEQFGIGGQDSVRGFLEREVIGDRGYSGTFELYSPDAGRAADLDGFRARALVFYDFGQVRRNEPKVLELGTQAIGSAGVGVRVSYRDRFSLRFDWAIVSDPGGTQQRGDSRGHFSVACAF